VVVWGAILVITLFHSSETCVHCDPYVSLARNSVGGLESIVSTGSRTLFVASFWSRDDFLKKAPMSWTRGG